MPGTYLNVLGHLPQPLVHLPAVIQGHLAIQDRTKERMGKPQNVTVTFDEASVDSLVDRCPRFLIVAGRADQSLARVGGGRDQPTQLPYIWRQALHATPYETTETPRYGDGLRGNGHLRVIKEHTSAFQGVKRIPATRLIQPGEGVPWQHRPQPRLQDRADRAQAQRTQPHTAKAIRR